MVQHGSPRVGITKGELGLCQAKSQQQASEQFAESVRMAERRAEASNALVAWRQCQKINPSNPQAVAESIEKAFEALKDIAKGEGRFSRDPLTHASNTIEDMKALAMAALQSAEQKGGS